MKIREGDAKDYLCPMKVSEQCVGKKCMAWRWASPVPYGGNSDEWVLGEDCGMPSSPKTKYEPRKGWCGMAGDPR